MILSGGKTRSHLYHGSCHLAFRVTGSGRSCRKLSITQVGEGLDMSGHGHSHGKAVTVLGYLGCRSCNTSRGRCRALVLEGGWTCRRMVEERGLGNKCTEGRKFSTEQMLSRELSRKTKATLGCQSLPQTEVQGCS